jgi:hypothetical protein
MRGVRRGICKSMIRSEWLSVKWHNHMRFLGLTPCDSRPSMAMSEVNHHSPQNQGPPNFDSQMMLCILISYILCFVSNAFMLMSVVLSWCHSCDYVSCVNNGLIRSSLALSICFKRWIYCLENFWPPASFLHRWRHLRPDALRSSLASCFSVAQTKRFLTSFWNLLPQKVEPKMEGATRALNP